MPPIVNHVLGRLAGMDSLGLDCGWGGGECFRGSGSGQK